MKPLLLAVLHLATAIAAHAQTTVPVANGARVRITAPMLPEPLFGRVTIRGAGTGAFLVSTPDEHARLSLRLAAVQRMDASRGRPRLAGAAVGAGVGLLAGAVIGAKQGGDADPEGFGALVGLIGGAGAGLTFGAVLGFAYAPERWRTVYQRAASDTAYAVVLSSKARVRRFADGSIAVKGERDRRRGVIRGAVVLGAVALVFGGIDNAQGQLRGGEYIGTIAGNAVIGGALGYLLAPRGWQKLPAPH